MSFLGINLAKIATKVAPKLISATTIGGSKPSQTLLKSAVNNAVFKPVYEKFGSDFERGAKIAGGIAAGAATAGIAGPLFGGGATVASGTASTGLGSLVTKGLNLLPKNVDLGGLVTKGFDFLKGAISKSANKPGAATTTTGTDQGEWKTVQSGTGKALPTWAVVLIVAGIAMVAFGKKMKSLFR